MFGGLRVGCQPRIIIRWKPPWSSFFRPVSFRLFARNGCVAEGEIPRCSDPRSESSDNTTAKSCRLQCEPKQSRALVTSHHESLGNCSGLGLRTNYLWAIAGHSTATKPPTSRTATPILSVRPYHDEDGSDCRRSYCRRASNSSWVHGSSFVISDHLYRLVLASRVAAEESEKCLVTVGFRGSWVIFHVP